MIAGMITIVVSVYNMGKYLPRAMQCLSSQTYKNYEVIIVDDGSTDDSSQICDQQGKKYQANVIHKVNGGLSSARNVGIENARGEFIVFPDPDDWVDEDYLSCLVSQHNDTDLEICGHYVTFSDHETIHNPKGDQQILDINKALQMVMESYAYCGFAWNKLYHMDIILKNGLRFDTDLGMAQDLHFAVKYIMCCNQPISYNPKPVLHYIQHEAGVTNVKHGLTPRKISGLLTYEKIAEITKMQYPQISRKAYATFVNMSFQFMMMCFDANDNLSLIETFAGNIRAHYDDLKISKRISFARRLLIWCSLIDPKLSYMIWKKIK